MNGGGEKNGWLCESDGQFKQTEGCGVEKWCTGNFTKQTATANHEKLCVDGNSL